MAAADEAAIVTGDAAGNHHGSIRTDRTAKNHNGALKTDNRTARTDNEGGSIEVIETSCGERSPALGLGPR